MKEKLHIINHPLLRHKLGELRNKETQSAQFRELVKDISLILAYEAMREWEDFENISIETPIAPAKVERIRNAPVIVSVMRAGNGMIDPILSIIPDAPAGFIGIYRDKFIHNTVEYYFKMPKDIKGRQAILCDPLVATADTMLAAIERLKSYEVKEIKVLSILMSRDAKDRIHHFFPDVDLYIVGLEEKVTEEGYLLPGLGDAGDRLYHTK